MLTEDKKKELLDNLAGIRKEISSLKAKLNEINSEKESAFKEKDSYKQEILELIKTVKDAKAKRDNLTKRVKEAKDLRQKAHEEIKQVIDQKKSTRGEVKANPSAIKHEIEKLEYKIETEVLSFDKEKELMKLINKKKKEYEEAKKAAQAWNLAHASGKNLDELRTKADESHNSAQTLAAESQKNHEIVISASKKIDELRKKEEESFKKFSELKEKFNLVNEELKKKLAELSPLNEEMQKNNMEVKEVTEQKKRQTLKEMELAVEEKIKKGMKLTTEDLLVFQKNHGSDE